MEVEVLKVNWEDEDNIMDWTLEIISKAVWCPHAVVQRVMSDKDGMHQSRSNVRPFNSVFFGNQRFFQLCDFFLAGEI